MELFFDVETSGFINKKLAVDDPKQAWILQLAFIVSDKEKIYTEFSSLITANGRSCHPAAQKIHGISTEDCNKGGMSEQTLLAPILHAFYATDTLVAHNITFDIELIDHLLKRCGNKWTGLFDKKMFCTMKSSTNLRRLTGRYGKFKWPKLTELYKFLFDEELVGAHAAMTDVRATRRCYYRLMEVLK